MQRINLTLPGEKSAQHLWGRASGQGRGGGAGRGRGGLPGPPSCPPRRDLARQAGSKHLPAAPLLLPAGPGDDPAAAAAAATGEEVPPPPPGEPHGDRHPVPAPAAGPDPSAGQRDLDVSPAGRAMVSAPQARVTTAGLPAPRPPHTHSPPEKNF